jgi:long-chain acyl-CoA synthetase
MPFILRPTITETFLDRVKLTPNALGFQYKLGIWKQFTFREFYDECRLTGFGLLGLGVQPGDRVAILSNTRYEWALIDMAILGARGVTVPIYPSSTVDDVAYLLEHSEARIAFVENRAQLEKVMTHRERLAKLERIVVLDPMALLIVPDRTDLVTLQALQEIGRREEAREPARFDRNLRDAKPEDVITICYTSGTTGTPKGVMITHDNVMSVLEDCVQVIARHVRPEAEVTVSFLPYSHILGKLESLAGYTFGWRCCYAESIEKIVDNLAELKPTMMFAVPRIFEKAYAAIRTRADAGPAPKRKLFDWALRTGRSYWGALWAGRRPGPRITLEYEAARRLVFRPVLERFGGRLRFAVCGGAPLPKDIGEFFQVVGIQTLEGYGLTETTAPIAVNTPDAIRFGTVGRPLPEVSVRIAEDGEVLIKSRKVFREYYKMPEETAAVLKNGWFHTGDIGHLDADGFLRITDRKKDLIITSGGKNVAPAKIENLAKAHPMISQIFVYGDRRNYLSALITLDPARVKQFAEQQQVLYSDYAALLKHPRIQAAVQRMIDEVNTHLASFETLKRFIILPREFTVEAGEMTPSLKLKRKPIEKAYAAQIESLYAT